MSAFVNLTLVLTVNRPTTTTSRRRLGTMPWSRWYMHRATVVGPRTTKSLRCSGGVAVQCEM